MNFELSLLDKDGFLLHSIEINEDEYSFSRYTSYGETYFVRRNKVLVERKAEYLPHDTLTVCCKMWKIQEGIRRDGQGYARIRIGIETV
ncbi:hypothetical protein AVEN_264216-1 [Araneus ventricosus]|uniref:MATH domain-containing protein n=1 Tax=Araneus ventricosus TaxID=182803 RepID=A0A4Y2T2E7_ARAVE|nr:hypothetical protein AVEN_95469-1 [Araneus ventricosus]GBN94381.1 hypothetical protein AVEN_264216-1 [Araneus ventricosus]